MTAEHIHDALTLLPADLIAETDKKRTQPPRRIIPWRRYAAMAACFALVLSSSWFCTKLLAPKGTTEAAKSAPAEAAVMQEQESGSVWGADTTAETQAAAAAGEPAEAQEDLCALPAAPVSEEAAEDSNASAASGSSALYAGMSQPRYLEALPGASTACFANSLPEPVVFRSTADLEAYRAKPIHRFDPEQLLDACAGYDESWFEDHDLLVISICGIPVGEQPQITEIRHYESRWKFLVEDYRKRTEAERRDWHILIETEKDLIGSEESLILTTALPGSEIPTQRIDTSNPDSDANYAGVPDELLVCSRAELDAYFLKYAHCYDFASMQEACRDYDESWFATHDLLLIVIQAAHPDTPWEIVDITKGSRWDWEVLVSCHGAFDPGQETNSIHLLAELNKGQILPEASIIRVTEVQPET